jgi:hypothetical protein
MRCEDTVKRIDETTAKIKYRKRRERREARRKRTEEGRVEGGGEQRPRTMVELQAGDQFSLIWYC